MQPRSLDQILGELNTTYQPQVDNLRRQQADIPGQQAAEEQGLAAKQTNAFDEITNGARRRGIGFSGIPLQEQAKYSSTEYMPALARLHTASKQQAMSLEDAINQIYERRNTTAQGIYQGDMNLAEQRRQAQEQMNFQREQAAAARSAQAAQNATPTMGSMGGGQAALPEGMQARTDKLGKLTGFNFNVGGKPASAAQYAAANKLPVGDVLYRMATAGDQTAANAYRWLQSYQQNDPKGFQSGAFKNTAAYKTNFSSLFWGA